jgi:V/A-type H+-transporting ATPase subunit D
MREATTTRSAALELISERELMREGYEFLDQQRILLATEMLRQLKIYEQLFEIFEAERSVAARALEAAVERHGLDVLQIYPAPAAPSIDFATEGSLLGVPLLVLGEFAEALSVPLEAIDPSPEAKSCRRAFERLLRIAADVAARASNLHRLGREYQRANRRAKALENVLLPEVEEAIRRVEDRLDAVDREELIHAKWVMKRSSTLN